jgi:hypothetical protein
MFAVAIRLVQYLMSSLRLINREKLRAEKVRDKKLAQSQTSFKVITMDLQSVLLSPRLNASALYYKTKLACHNFTIFDLVTKEVTCFVFGMRVNVIC